MSFDRLWTRLFGAFACATLLLLAVAAVIGELRVQRSHVEEIDRRLELLVDVLRERAGSALAAHESSADLDQRIHELARACELRLTLVALDGEVLSDSSATLPVANHADRPEIQAALRAGRGQDQRRSATTGHTTRYVALRVERDGKVVGCVRAAAELDRMERELAFLHRGLVAGGAGALALGLLASALLARRLSRPLEEMGDEARAFAAGQLSRRIGARGPAETRVLAQSLNTMAERLAARIDGERAARAELETILASMAEGVVAVDADERILLMNSAAARTLGLQEALATGTQLWQAVRFPELERELRAVLAGAQGRQVDATAPHDGGRTLSLSVAPVATGTSARAEEDGTPQTRSTGSKSGRIGAVVLISDVTTMRRLDQMRIDFVANVSHELRTPLTAIMGALETLADEHQDADTRARFIDIAARNAARLKLIVNDLLDLSSIEAQGDSMPLAPISIGEPLRTAAAALSGAAQKKGVRLEVAASDPALCVHGNPQRLEQCFTNLIANGIQYTPSGGHVRARVLAEAGEVRVEVADDGIGIPQNALGRVFERFYRVDRGRSRDTGGTGLGLAIVKHIVLAHGGRVDVRSEEGSGSTFTVHLPRKKAS